MTKPILDVKATVYAAKLDMLAIIITVLSAAVILVIPLITFTQSGSNISAMLVAAIGIPVLFVAWGFHPIRYIVNDRALIIKRPFKPLEIPISEMDSIREVSFRELLVSIRVFGSGGFFGYFGVYTSFNLGKIYMWATDRTKLVLITAGNKKYVVSPDAPAEFILQLYSLSKLH